MQRVKADTLLFAHADSARAFPETLEKVRRLEVVRRTAALYRSSPQPVPGPELLESIRAALDAAPGDYQEKSE
jgi:hypothetical protein